jgi:hypothetical protein
VNDAQSIFDFEKDFAGELYCIPMSVRLKLDNVGVKVSLKQWNKLGREERGELLQRPCASEPERHVYRDYLVAAITSHTGAEPKGLPVEAHPAWEEGSRAPEQVRDYCTAQGLEPLTPSAWAALTPLQRFALIKLTRPGHSNHNFKPALREFGLLADVPG